MLIQSGSALDIGMINLEKRPFKSCQTAAAFFIWETRSYHTARIETIKYARLFFKPLDEKCVQNSAIQSVPASF